MTALLDQAEDYVLGVLDPREAAEVEARLRGPIALEDRDLAIAVGVARDNLLSLDLTVPEVPLRLDAWTRMAASLSTDAHKPPRNVSDFGPPQERRARRWRFVAIAAMAASVLLATALAWRIFVVEVPTVVAVLLDDEGSAVAVLEAFGDDSVSVTPVDGADPGPMQVFQIWTKPDPDGPPVSLGILATLRRTNVAGPDLPQLRPDQLYEITREPAGGSPTGLPTGPIVGKGFARPL